VDSCGVRALGGALPLSSATGGVLVREIWLPSASGGAAGSGAAGRPSRTASPLGPRAEVGGTNGGRASAPGSVGLCSHMAPAREVVVSIVSACAALVGGGRPAATAAGTGVAPGESGGAAAVAAAIA